MKKAEKLFETVSHIIILNPVTSAVSVKLTKDSKEGLRVQ